MTLRSALPDEAPALAKLATSIPGAPAWTAESWRSMAADPLRLLLLLVSEETGNCLGMAAASLLPPEPFEAELEAVAVLPGLQRRGHGRQLVAAVQQWAASRAARVLRLEVRASNTAALGLYAACGFVAGGRRRGYYAHPAEDAVLMQWAPPQPAASADSADFR